MNRSNNNNNDDCDLCRDENNLGDVIQCRKARVKVLFQSADKISTSLCDLTNDALSIARQMKELLEERSLFSRLHGAPEYSDQVKQLYTIADEIEDLCLEWNQLLELSKYCFALRCNENVGKDDFTIEFVGCGTYIGQALRRNTTLTYIHLKIELLLENDDDDIQQTMNPLIDFVQTSTSLCNVSLDGVETTTRSFAGQTFVVKIVKPNLTGPVHKLTCLFFDAIGKNKHIESLRYRGIVPTSAFDRLMSTTQSLKFFEADFVDPGFYARGTEALICSAFTSNHTIQHLKFVPATGDWGLARGILLDLHNCLPKLRRLTLTCHDHIYGALEPFLHHTTIEHFDLLDFSFHNHFVANCLINGLKQHYFGTSKPPRITKLSFKDCMFDASAKDELLEFKLTHVEMLGCQVMLLPLLMYTANVIARRQSKHLLVGLMKAQDSIGPYSAPQKRKLCPEDN